MINDIERLEERLRDAAAPERPAALNALADRLILSDPERAAGLASEAAALARELEQPTALAGALRTLGAIHTNRADYPGALEHFREIVRINREIGDHLGEARAITNLAVVHAAIGNHHEALELLRDQVARIETLGTPRLLAHTLYSLAMAHGRLGAFDRSLAALERALELNRHDPTDADLGATIHLGMGVIYGELGSYSGALEHFHHALALKQAAGDRQSASTILSNIAVVQSRNGNLEEAIRVQHRAIEIDVELGTRRELANSLINLGSFLVVGGRPAEALEHLRRGLAVSEEIGDVHDYATGLSALAEAYRDLGRLDEARETISRSIEIREGIGERVEAVKGICIRARIELLAGRPDRALEDLHRGLPPARELDNLPLTALIHRWLSEAYRSVGDLPAAFEHFRLHSEASDGVFRLEAERRVEHLRLLREADHARSEAEQLRMKAEQMEREMELQNRHLTALAMSVVQQNEFLMSVRGDLMRAAGEAGGEEAGTADGGRGSLRKIAGRIRAQAASSERWSAFQEQFEKLHGEFIRTISERHPSLSPAELKVCALLKLDLSSRDIADILCVTLRCAQTHRYNIRRKLGLPPKSDLTAYFRGI